MPRGMPVGDKSGLVADWSTLVDTWERAAHLKVEQGKHDQGLVDFDPGLVDIVLGLVDVDLSQRRSGRHPPLQVQGWAVPAASKVPGAEIKLFNLERWRT